MGSEHVPKYVNALPQILVSIPHGGLGTKRLPMALSCLGICHHPTRWAQNEDEEEALWEEAKEVSIPHGGLGTPRTGSFKVQSALSPSHTVGSEQSFVNNKLLTKTESPSHTVGSEHSRDDYRRSPEAVTIPHGGLRTQSMRCGAITTRLQWSPSHTVGSEQY